MRIAVLSETLDTDVRVYENLVTKILQKKPVFVNIEGVKFRGKSSLISQLPIAVEILMDEREKPDLIVIVADADNLKSNEQIKQIRKILENKVDNLPPSMFVVGSPKRNIESWLLADTRAINTIEGITRLGSYKSPDMIRSPKEKMKELYYEYLSKCKKGSEYPIFLKEISMAVNVNVLINKSPSFKLFAKNLKQAVKLT